MDFQKIRVLVTDAGGRQTLSIIKGLKTLGCHVTVMGNKRSDVCHVSRLPDRKILHPDADSKSDNYNAFVEHEIASGKYDVLLPIAEVATNKLTLHEDEYKKYVKIACAPRAAYIQAYNKQNTFEHAMDAGIPCSYTRRRDQDLEDFLAHTKFPVIIKPRQGLGSIGFHKFNTADEFHAAMREKKFDPDQYVIQEFVKFQKRISTYVFMDSKGQVDAALAMEVLRWYPLDAGTAVAIRTIDRPDIIDYSAQLLREMKYQGFANPSFMIDEETGEPKLCEVNGRIPASVKMCWMCGFNVGRMLLEMAYGEDVTQYGMNSKFGLITRHSQADWIWFLKSPYRFSCEPSWFSWKNTKDVVFSWDDPIPYFAYTFHQLCEFKNIKKMRSRNL